jgi:surface polysaccharide O-acyltransferase-like enzyme
LGVYAYRQRWFGTDGYRPDPEFWSAMATALGLAVVVHKLAYGSQLGLFSVRVVNDLLHCSFCLSITLALLGVFQIRFDRTSPLATSMAANSYAIYFIHQLIVQPLNLAIRPLHCNILLKYLVVAVPAVVLCYLISRYVLAKLPPFAMRRSLQQSAAL